MYSFFSRSSKRSTLLKEAQHELCEEDLRLVRLCPTRWLSLHACVDKLLRSLQSIVHVLESERTSAKSKDERKRIDALIEKIQSYKFVGVTHYLADILSSTATLCRQFQAEDIDLIKSASYLQACTKTVQEDYIDAKIFGPRTRNFLQEGRNNGFLSLLTLNYTEEEDLEMRAFFEDFASFLIKNITSRFEATGASAHLSTISVENIRTLPENQIPCFGLEIDKLVDSLGYGTTNSMGTEFAPFIDANATRGEWQIFKRWIRLDCLTLNQAALTFYILRNARTKFPNICKLLMMIELLPVSSACCERGFSEMQNTKTDLRNLLGIDISLNWRQMCLI